MPMNFQPCPDCPAPQECAAMGQCAMEAAAMQQAPQQPMGLKKGGSPKRKAYAKGGSVRGCGKAKKGVRKAKVY